MSAQPLILLSNDDGIEAEGLKVLERVAATLSDNVWVVAPEREQSGASHSLTLHTPVRVKQYGARRFSVSGTPTDCVMLALKEIVPQDRKVDLLLSGVNWGSNAADDITYSGTVAAAMEATILGVRSMALSLLTNDTDAPFWSTAEACAKKVVPQLMQLGWREDTLMNLNFPACPVDKVQGVRVCPQGKRKVGVSLLERADPKGRPYYWIGGERDNTANKPGVDVDWLHRDYVTVTPINMDMTDYTMLEAVGKVIV